ncbi:hypothetical protein DEO72_LG5g3318 [Vigna unguiculata]|uniref:Uncharacterized protein n=1 Tax=Vigna unguiculata TaxID=3917 RepID=A0A4D6M2B3_VIGUN|nr:hypothetical protein DEO72_LG5g3318 [Vigna unguiculata]
MAAELVGGALLSAFLRVAFDRLASPQFVDFFRGRKLDEKLLDNLKIMLHSINALADDAEHKQFTHPHVKAWLFSVKEAVFDAEDLLEEIDYELTRCQVEAESQPQTFSYKVSNFFNSTFSSFNKKIESGMKEVLEKLEYLAKQKGPLGLKESTYPGDGSARNLTDAKRLRSFLSITNKTYNVGVPCQFKTLIDELFSKFKFLHVLSLYGYSGLTKVPDSVGDLKQLLLEELPSSLHKLTKLRCLEFEDTRVTKMPMHFGELKNLHVLNTFCVDRNSASSTKQLGGLGLHEKLSINEVQNIVNPSDALEANLKNKDLVELELKWNSNHIPDDARKEKKVLENLQPPKNLKHLSIISYCGTQFPSWVFDNSLSNLVFLLLEDCKFCLCLPPFGLLPSLKTLVIRGFDGIVSIGDEFCGSNSSSFSSLEILVFYNMEEWEEWECKTTSFPRLQHLSIDKCRKLKGLPENFLHLKKLNIHYCDMLVISLNSMVTSSLQLLSIHSCPLVNIPLTHCDFLEEVTIDNGCDSLTTFQLKFFPKLRLLHLKECQNLRRISQEHAHDHLKEISIYDCPQFESFPDEGLSAPWLLKIAIREAKNLKLLPKRMQILLPSLVELRIIDCPLLEMFPDGGGLPSNVKHVYLFRCSKLIASMRGTWDANTCLERFWVNMVDVECFPDEGLVPHSVTCLRISECPNLRKLNYKGLYHLSSLTLFDCPNLQCLPEEGLPKSITSLTILDCSLLQPRCQNPKAEDWEKIAHIENLKVGQ